MVERSRLFAAAALSQLSPASATVTLLLGATRPRSQSYLHLSIASVSGFLLIEGFLAAFTASVPVCNDPSLSRLTHRCDPCSLSD
jgi:hypothetical protein